MSDYCVPTNLAMDFSYSPENLEMQRTLRRFMDAEVLPRNRGPRHALP